MLIVYDKNAPTINQEKNIKGSKFAPFLRISPANTKIDPRMNENLLFSV